MGRYSSEEESDTENKLTKKKENRRATMAAPVMQPPPSNVKIRKSIRLTDPPENEVSLIPFSKHFFNFMTRVVNNNLLKYVNLWFKITQPYI